MSLAAEALDRRAARRRNRLIAVIREPIREARVDPVDRVPPPWLLVFVLAVSGLVHVGLLKGAWRARTRAENLPQRRADIRVPVIERPLPMPVPSIAPQAEAPTPAPRRKIPHANAAISPAPVKPAPAPPPQEVPSPADKTETPPVADAPPLLMPGIGLSATTAVGGLAVRTGNGAGSAGSASSANQAASGSEPGGGTKVVPGYALTEEPVFLDNVSPAEIRKYYPEDARKAKVEGAVQVKLLVDQDGNVGRATLVSDPSGLFGRAALKVARLYRFKPAKLNDRHVATEIEFTIHFELD